VWRAMTVAGVGQTAGDVLQFYLPVYARAAGLSASTIGVLLAAHSAAQFGFQSARLRRSTGPDERLPGKLAGVVESLGQVAEMV